MKKTKRHASRRKKQNKRSRKIKIGGDGGELANPIVRMLFSRERNIFFFLEFVNMRVNSDNEADANSALGIKEMLNVLTIIIESINSRTTNLQEEELTWRESGTYGGRRKNKRKKRLMTGGNMYELMKLGFSVYDDDSNEDYWNFVSPNITEQYESAYEQYGVQKDKDKDKDTEEEEDLVFHDVIELPEKQQEHQQEQEVSSSVPPVLLAKMSEIFGQLKGAFNKVLNTMEEIQGLADDEDEKEEAIVQKKPDEDMLDKDLPQAQVVTEDVQVAVAVPVREEGEKEEQNETDLDVYIFIVQLTNLYVSKKLEKMNTVDSQKQLSILGTLGKYASIIFDKLNSLASVIDITDTTALTTAKSPPSLGENTLLTQEDKDNFNNFSLLEKEFADTTSHYQSLVQSKLEDIEDKSVLARIANRFCEKFHTDLREYIKTNEGEYRDFIDKLFLQKQSNEDSVLMKIREYNYLINENIIGMLLNKDMSQTILKELGLVLDVSSFYTLYSMFNSIASEGLLGLASSAAESSNLSVISGQALKDPKQFVKLLLSLNNGRELTSTILKPEVELNPHLAAADLVAASSPISKVVKFGARSFKNLLNSSAGILYKNNESINKMIEKYEGSEQVINLAADVSNLVSDITYMLVNNKYKTDDDIWRLLVSEKTLYKDDIVIQDKLNQAYVSIFLDYKQLIVDLNNSICRVRCKETMVPEKFLEDSSQNTNFISYLDVTEDEIVMMFKYVSDKFPALKDTLLLLEKVTSRVIDEIEKKFNMCEFIKKSISNRLLESNPSGQPPPPPQQPRQQQPQLPEPVQVQEPTAPPYEKSKFRSSSQVYAEEGDGYSSFKRIGAKFGGSQVIVPREKESLILEYICIIINCDFKEKFGVDTDSLTDRTNILLERKNALENLTETRMETINQGEINGIELLDDIRGGDGYDSFLEKIDEEYKSHSLKQNTSSLQVLSNNNFLRVVLNSVSDLRVKLCYELLYAYYQTEAFKTFMYQEENKFVHQVIIDGLRVLFVPIKSSVTSWGWKGLYYFSKGFHTAKNKISDVIAPIARSSGFDDWLEGTNSSLNEVIQKTGSLASSSGGTSTTRKKRKNHRRKGKTKLNRKSVVL
jgi:hypothetical protein